MEFCENFTYEDNFNNTLFGKILPHTTAVATEFEAKVQVFSGIANERGNLGLHLLTYVFFICNIQCSFAPRFVPNCVVSSFVPFTGSFLTDSLFTPKWFILSIYLKAYL